MINSLVIAPTFLRSSCAVGQIERHFIANLPQSHYSHVLCSSNYDMNINGDRFVVYQRPERNVFHYIDVLARKMHISDLSYSPDAFYYSWNGRAYREAKKIIKSNKIDYILTINNPVSSHLLGLKLKQKYGTPWLAYLFDPWHNNPFRQYKWSCFDKKDAHRERLVADNADVLLFPNQELLDSWIAIYGENIKSKSFVLPFATSIPEIKGKTNNDGKVVISHIGTLSESRRANVFLEALNHIKQHSPDNYNQLQLNIVGYISDLDKKLIDEYKLNDVVNVVGHISEQECVHYYEQSDMFLIIDINCSPNLFYPSKLLKYFCYKKPIIGITTENSVVANELSKTGNHVFKYDDSHSLSIFLNKVVEDFSFARTNDVDYYKKFLVENVSEEYLKILNNILV